MIDIRGTRDKQFPYVECYLIMLRKKISVLLVFIAMATLSVTATDYGTLSVKAQRFYQYKEWASAVAMYRLMLDHRPDVADTYCHAIVASSIDRQQAVSMQLLSQAINSHVPLDSIYDGVQRLSFEQGNASLYENFLEMAALEFPWMKRNIDARLLAYYEWRRDGDGMVGYAERMLAGLPDSIEYLTALADGYFTQGDDAKAIETYNKVLAIDPDNYHALLVLGNYYFDKSCSNEEARVLAIQYLKRADSHHSTPYVTTLLSALARSSAK